MRLRSIPITDAEDDAYQVTCTWPCVTPVRRSIAGAEMKRLTSERMPASVRPRLRLAVTELMRGAGRDPDAKYAEQRGDEVGTRVRGLGDEAEAARR